MTGIVVTQHIAAPVEKVFELFTDFKNCPTRIKAITKMEILTPGPVGVGTRFRETRVFLKHEATEEMEITAFEPNRSYTLGCNSCGAVYTTVHRFEPEGGGTLVTLDFSVKAVSVWARLMKPLSWLMMGTVKKCIAGDIEALKRCAEQGS